MNIKKTLCIAVIMLMASMCLLISCDVESDVSSNDNHSPSTPTTVAPSDDSLDSDSSESDSSSKSDDSSGNEDDSSSMPEPASGLTINFTIDFTDKEASDPQTVMLIYGINGFDATEDMMVSAFDMVWDPSHDVRTISFTVRELPLTVGDKLYLNVRMIDDNDVCVGNLYELHILDALKEDPETKDLKLEIDGVWGSIDVGVGVD